MNKRGTGSGEPKTIDQQLISELLEEESISSKHPKPKEEKPEETKKVKPFAESFSRKIPPIKESAILAGLDQHGIPKDFISQGMHWIEQNPLETILGAIVIGGIGYKLYQHFTRKPNPETEQALKNRFSRERKKRKREKRKRSFMEKANDLFHSENDQGERKIDFRKTVTVVSVAAAGVLTGVIASKKTLPVTLLGASSLAVAGYGLNSPLVTLGAIGMTVGAFVSDLVRKTLKRSNDKLEGVNQVIPDQESLNLKENTIGKQRVEQFNVEEEMESKEDFSTSDPVMWEFEEEKLPELA